MDKTFQGDLTRLSLGEVLQTLSSGGKVGVLSLDLGGPKTEVLLADGQVSLGTGSFDDRAALVHQVLALRLIDERKVAEILEMRRTSGRSVTDLLRREVGIPAQTIEELRRQWYTDQILGLFRAHRGTFAFYADLAVASRIASGGLPTLPVEGVLMEAARQMDEWTLLAHTIPHGSVVLAAAGAPPRLELDADAAQILSHLIHLFDGDTPFDAAAEKSYLGRFDFAKWAAHFLAAGALVRIADQDLLDRARRLAKSFDRESLAEDPRPAALSLYDSYLADHPGDAAALLERGDLHLDLGRPAEAASAYAFVVPAWIAEGRFAPAFDLIERGLAAQPDHRALEETIALFFPAGVAVLGEGSSRLFQRALALTERWSREKRLEEALGLLDSVLLLDSANEAVRQKAINLAIDIGRTDLAADHYDALARARAATGEWKKLIEIYQKIRKLDPKRRDITRKIDEAAGRLRAQDPRLVARTRKKRIAAFVGGVAAMALVAREFALYSKYRKLDVAALVAEDRHADAIDTLDRFREGRRLSLAGVLAGRRRTEVENGWQTRREERSEDLAKEAERARTLAARGDFDPAIAILEKTLAGPLTESFRIEVEKLAREIGGVAADWKALRERIDRSLGERDHARAYQTAWEAYGRYRDRELIAREIKIPVHVVPLPADARMLGPDGSPEPVGPDRVLLVPPGGSVTLVLVRDDLGELPFVIDAGSGAQRIVPLDRPLAFDLALLPKAPDLAADHGDRLYLSLDSNVLALDAGREPRIAWRAQPEELGGSITALAAFDGGVLAAGADAWLYRLDESGSTLWREGVAATNVKTLVALDGIGAAAVVLAEKRRIDFVSLAPDRAAGEARVLWSFTDSEHPEGEIRTTPVAAPGGRLAVHIATRDRHYLHLLDLAARKATWSIEIRGDVLGGLVVSGGRLYFQVGGPTGGTLHAIDLATGADQPGSEPFAPASLPPVAIGDRVLFFTNAGSAHAAPGGASTRLWVAPTSSAAVGRGSLVYLGLTPWTGAGDRGRVVLAIRDTDFEPLWLRRLDAEVWSRPFALGEWIVLITVEGRVLGLAP